MFVRKFITILNIVLNDFFECLRFSCVYNKGSEIISVVVYILKIYIYFAVSDAICRLSTFILDSRLLLSTLDNYSRLSTFTLDSRPSTFRYTLAKQQLKKQTTINMYHNHQNYHSVLHLKKNINLKNT